jgi:hypothetical protein
MAGRNGPGGFCRMKAGCRVLELERADSTRQRLLSKTRKHHGGSAVKRIFGLFHFASPAGKIWTEHLKTERHAPCFREAEADARGASQNSDLILENPRPRPRNIFPPPYAAAEACCFYRLVFGRETAAAIVTNHLLQLLVY